MAKLGLSIFCIGLLYLFHPIRCFLSNRVTTKNRIFIVRDRPKWLDRSDQEEVIYKNAIEYTDAIPLFDVVHLQKEQGSFHSLSTYSLKVSKILIFILFQS